MQKFCHFALKIIYKWPKSFTDYFSIKRSVFVFPSVYNLTLADPIHIISIGNNIRAICGVCQLSWPLKYASKVLLLAFPSLSMSFSPFIQNTRFKRHIPFWYGNVPFSIFTYINNAQFFKNSTFIIFQIRLEPIYCLLLN